MSGILDNIFYSPNQVTTLSYPIAEEFIAVGWSLSHINRYTLPGINIKCEECTLIWNKTSAPVFPKGREPK